MVTIQHECKSRCQFNPVKSIMIGNIIQPTDDAKPSIAASRMFMNDVTVLVHVLSEIIAVSYCS